MSRCVGGSLRESCAGRSEATVLLVGGSFRRREIFSRESRVGGSKPTSLRWLLTASYLQRSLVKGSTLLTT